MQGFIEHLGSIADPRVERTTKHKLIAILFLTLAAVLCGCDEWEAIEAFGAKKEGFGRSVFLALSDNYLTSESCMLELNAISRGTEEYASRFFFLIAANATIIDPDERSKSIAFWDNEINRLEESENRDGETPRTNQLLYKRNKYSNFRNNLDNILQFLLSVNTFIFYNSDGDLIKSVAQTLGVKTRIDSEQTKVLAHG